MGSIPPLRPLFAKAARTVTSASRSTGRGTAVKEQTQSSTVELQRLPQSFRPHPLEVFSSNYVTASESTENILRQNNDGVTVTTSISVVTDKK
jgi:hypothetical protein